MPVAIHRSGGRGGNLRRIAQWAGVLLRHLKTPHHHVSLVLCDDAFILELNQRYRGKDQATDVLSFPQDGLDGPVLGDVVISTETARRQAARVGHSLDQELAVLLVHGLCHLRGHDHLDDQQAGAMGVAEADLLAALNPDFRQGLVGRVHVSA
jgi:probable rRNA maturation factor